LVLASCTMSAYGFGRLALRSAAVVVPDKRKADRRYDLLPHCGGEDAYFFDDEAGFVGVADGVGGWARHGVDAGRYSRQLMSLCADAVRAGVNDPAAVLTEAHSRTSERGSSTALVVALLQARDKSARLKAANLGDSGFLVLRQGRILLQSTPQQHSFNFPFQLLAPNTHPNSDSPHDAEIFELENVLPDDVIILGTDGLFDNMFPYEVSELMVSLSAAADQTPKGLAGLAARELAHKAAAFSRDASRRSPFAVEAKKEGHWFHGGKVDDITVVVSVVIRDLGEEAKPLKSKL